MGSPVHVSPETVIAVITKPPRERSVAEIDVLLPWLKKRSNQFADLDRECLIRLIKFCAYEKAEKDDVIIKQGDKGEKFYIMLTGRTAVYIDTVKSDDDPPPPLPPEITMDNSDSDDETVDESFILQGLAQKKKKLDRSKFGKHIINFEEGKSFGEIALISEDAVRNASIISDDETDMLVIHRELFNETLKAKQEEEYRERKHFADTCALFRHWTPKFRRLTEMSVRKECYPFDSYIVRQGEPVEGLYFIIKGQGKVIVDPAAHRTQYRKLFEQGEAKETDSGIQHKKKEVKLRESSMNEQIRVRRRVGYASAEKRLAQKTLTVCYVNENEMIGDTEVVLGLEKHTQSVICTANTEVFILDTKNIDRLINKKNPYTMEQLRDIVENKLRSRQESKLGAQVDIYRHLYGKVLDMKPRRNAPLPTDEKEAGPATDPRVDKDLMVSQLTKLFLESRTPFIEPAVAGSVYYVTKSRERAKRNLSAQLQRRSKKKQSGEVRLQRARRAAIRQPRSRRELEKLTIGVEETKPLQDKDHAVNRFLVASSGKARPRAMSVASAPSRRNGETSLVATSGRHCGDQSRHGGGGDGGIFKLTELEIPEDGQVHIGREHLRDNDVKQIVLSMGDQQQERNSSRAKFICNMMDKRANKARENILRPKSAPSFSLRRSLSAEEQDDHDENFDPQTSNTALTALEERIRSFHDKHDQDGKKVTAQVQGLRRFSINRPDDVPIPGGTVYVKTHACKYPPGMYVSPANHQHIRRYIIPKDAYSVATLSMAAIESSSGSSSQERLEPRPPGGGGGEDARTRRARRAQSAPLSRHTTMQRAPSSRSVWS